MTLLCLSMALASTAMAGDGQADTAGSANASTRVLEQMRALRRDDPAAALALGEAHGAGTSFASDEDVALALELVDAAAALGQHARVIQIGTALRTQATLDTEQRLRLLRRLNASIWFARDQARIAELESDLARLVESSDAGIPGEAELWRQLAASYYLMGARDEALRLARFTLSRAPQTPNLTSYATQQIVSAILAQQGHLPEAIEALLEAERIGKALERPEDPALLHNFTGLFVYAKDWPRAIDYASRALALLDANPGAHRLPRESVLNNLGSAYEGMGDLERAEAAYREALEAVRANDQPAGSTLNNLAHVLRLRGKTREALSMLRDAADAMEAAGDTVNTAVVWSNLGATLDELGERQAAADAYARSYALFQDADTVPKRLELYPRMIDNLEALGRHREALALMREFKETSDAFVSVESNQRIAELESAIDLARKESELAELERDKAARQIAFAQLEAREHRQRLIGYGLFAGLITLAILAALKIRESRYRQRINQALERKNAEIEAQHRDLEKLNDTIRRHSEEDALTGLHNRRFVHAFLDRIGGAHAQARRQDHAPTPVLIALLDIDHFKRVNDEHGHEAGDHALMHFGEILRGCAGPTDVVARWGGEEFLWIAPDASLRDAPRLFQRMRERLRQQPLLLQTGTLPLSLSMGYTLFPLWQGQGGDWSLSLRIADAALYRAKNGGRDRCVGFAANGPGPALDDLAAGLTWVDGDELEAHGWLLRIEEDSPSS